MARRKSIAAVAIDAVALLVAMEIASLAVFEDPIPWRAQGDAGPMLAAIAAGAALGLFISFRPVINTFSRPSYGRAMSMSLIMLASTSVALVFSRVYWSRAFVLVTFGAWLGIGLVHRWIRRLRSWTETLVVITSEKALVDHLLGATHADLVAVLDPAGTPPERLSDGATLAVDLRAVLSDEMARFVSSCNLAGLPVRSLTSVYEEHTGRLPIVHLHEGWELTVPLARRKLYVQVKRIVDTILVVVTLPVSLVLGGLIALAIKMDSRGPVIFRQRRIGLGGRPFTLYKFRTMRAQADIEARFAERADNRLTRVGRVLRRVRIDELPQLWNVLKGDLSLVGPRPEQGAFVERFSDSIPFYMHRHLVRPGITGWAQVNFGYADNEADTVEKLSFDLYYVKHLSVWLDVEVLGRSVWTVMSGFGAR
ncbi:MAG TPA: exopolysaccharide biosynthesis polyprenyl glycosylphosphotransferase [Acidimicrobiia bacterium]|nr:exopolysaccharide biosynthesis polyprenyl glycosylphosphotransferase [Acidimicrobiia bacterium]